MKDIACTSPWIPAEWIAAHGLRPVRLRPRRPDPAGVAGLGRGLCPYAGAMLDAVLGGPDADAVVFTTACDQMRYAAAAAEAATELPLFLLNVPSTWQTPAATQLFRDEMERFGRFLERLGGVPPTREQLIATVLHYAETRRGEVGSHPASPSTATPLALLGGPLSETDGEILAMIEAAGGRVVLDATEGGERTLPVFDRQRLQANPLCELVEAYLHIPAIFRRPNQGLYEWLGRELTGRDVRGIVFRRYLWCDLWHAELQRLKQWSPVPLLDLDADRDEQGALSRTRNRVEAFLEMLR